MNIISLSSFKGLAPGIAPTNLEATAAQAASNCILSSTAIRPLGAPVAAATPSKAGTKKTIFPYGAFWLHWTDDVDVVTSPIARDPFGRVYWTGDGAPKYAVSSIITAGGGTDYPTNSYALGLPVPTNAITVTPEAHSAAAVYLKGHIVRYGAYDFIAVADNGPAAWDPANWQELEVNQIEAVSYVWRFVSAYGEVGPASLPSDPISTGIGQKRTLTNCPTAPGGAHNITKKQLYRTLTSSSGTEFRFCLETDIATATVVDDVDDSALTDALPDVDWIAPPADLKGLINLANGSLAGFAGNSLYLTPPNQPHAFPLEYQRSFPFPVVAIGAYGNTILVTTTSFPFIVYGDDPANMQQERLEEGQPCLSKRGLVDMGDSIIYPTPLGLAQVGSTGVKNLTTKLMTGKEWVQQFKPDKLTAFRHEGRYIAFHDTGGFIFDPDTLDLVTIDIVATAGHATKADLFLQIGADIVKWDAGAALTASWKSKEVVTSLMNPGVGRVTATGYPVTFKLNADGVLRWTQTVESEDPFPLPDDYLGTSFNVEVSGNHTIKSVQLAQTVKDL